MHQTLTEWTLCHLTDETVNLRITVFILPGLHIMNLYSFLFNCLFLAVFVVCEGWWQLMETWPRIYQSSHQFICLMLSTCLCLQHSLRWSSAWHDEIWETGWHDKIMLSHNTRSVSAIFGCVGGDGPCLLCLIRRQREAWESHPSLLKTPLSPRE